ncbi:putative Ubiquitin carboxyl-terminal hydrolase [Monocercomonoides exilis]|uniref:putative Ubiquitin carboxyl-terminal hydrolase n=1 Tax=Monocercomonoides exilis TaxID=2049356 RepID=UPI00355A80FC|nr:putative Ubiquitin carboxyl-terminal hydrolase [Monocercomonoides exilis]|eukprot:MONOS_2113.1-p1 / transcript=MONOS_2113.1 / gene=MONOS_2113 / organism=Monocercomonoides_exilis_PA203 / gene_product=unspecified product / transcript_product=unspecified product / location=Mono_scaffold00041:126653-128206(+) / protein_length=517 / sequence_SO=supercontig / SO=protein_coding / is_pseudo=false
MAHRGLYNPNTLCFVNSVIIQLFMHLQFRYSIIAFPLDEEGCDGWNSYDSVYDDLVSGAELHDCDDKEAIFSQQKESSPTSSRFIDNKENHIHKGPQIQMTCDECHLNFNETHHYYHKHFLREKHEKWERLAAKKSQNAINQYHNEILELQNLFLRMEFDQSEEHLDALQFLKHFRMDTGADIKPGVEYDSNEFLVTLLSHISMYLIRKQSPNFVFRLFQISLQNQIVCNNVHINSSYEENLVLNISIENSSFLSEAIAQTLLGAKIQFPCPLCAEQRAVATKACSSSSSSSSASTSSSTIPSQGASYSAQNGFSIANALNSAITRTALVTLPNTLIIRLKRQSFDPLHGKVYSNSYLSFPYRYDELLDLTPFMADVREQSEEGLCGNDIFSLQQSHLENGGASFLKSFSGKKSRCFAEGSLKYRLVGIVNYCGSGETGHYWSLVRKEGAEKSWIVFNDEYVKEVDESLIPSMCFGASGQQRQFQKLSRYGGFSKLSSSDPFEKGFKFSILFIYFDL